MELRQEGLTDKTLHHAAHEIDLILIHSVIHVWVQTLGDLAAQLLQYFCGLVDPLFRNMEVHIAASQKDGCPCQGAFIIARRIIGTNQSST